ncbi:hypothetical protein Vretimale_6485 [Volvox reticuliferus]|uniref:Uncharacterized protein n=1 Tax=Volvox reticuliferus TaxID=1737510 RepID=A0A8J4CZU6_9CHLO|nr:hypothetical protein Vretifemale_19987 [Volvox reticuliferus]GIM01684.1 hypothetical protein Vretimale_6485 [Volvox reticuliferus]
MASTQRAVWPRLLAKVGVAAAGEGVVGAAAAAAVVAMVLHKAKRPGPMLQPPTLWRNSLPPVYLSTSGSLAASMLLGCMENYLVTARVLVSALLTVRGLGCGLHINQSSAERWRT